MVKVGQVVMKIAGRDAGKIGIITEVFDNNLVMIDGAVRKKKCNIKHLEFLGKEAKLGKNPSREEIRRAINSLGFELPEFKESKRKEKKEKPKKTRTVKKKAPIKK